MEIRIHRWVLVLIIGVVASASASENAPQLDDIDKTAIAELLATNTPGAALAITRGDQIIYAKGFGVANAEDGTPVTADMLFRIGSTTKMFTAAALVAQSLNGKVKLDAPVGGYIKGLNVQVAAITGDQLLSHRAGLIDEAPMHGLHDDSALGAGIRTWSEARFFAKPGEVFSYANPGYWLAGYLLEETTGKPFADAMADVIFNPVGMTRTTFRPTVAMTFPLALGHDVMPDGKRVVIRPFADNAATWPAGSMFSNVNDLSRFAIAMMNGGRIGADRVLPEALVAALVTPHADAPGDDYGYGITIGRIRGLRTWYHSGGRSGYGSIIYMFPDQKVAVVSLVNRTGGQIPRSVNAALEKMLPLAAPDTSTPQTLEMTEAEMQRYVGRYAQGEMSMDIYVEEGKLKARQGAGPGQQVSKLGDGRFAILVNGRPMGIFHTVNGADGKPSFVNVGARALKRVSTP